MATRRSGEILTYLQSKDWRIAVDDSDTVGDPLVIDPVTDMLSNIYDAELTQLYRDRNMSTAYDGKYGKITAEKKIFHEGEPVFVLRAQDPYAPYAVLRYASFCEENGCLAEHVAACRKHAEKILQWQKDHPELVKIRPGESK